MIDKDIRSMLDEETILFDNPAFDNSIIGVTDDNRAVYNYDNMIEELMVDDDISFKDSMDFIDFNTIRALDYYPTANKPIIVYPFQF